MFNEFAEIILVEYWNLYQRDFQSSLIMNTVNISVEIVIAVVFRHTTIIHFLARDIKDVIQICLRVLFYFRILFFHFDSFHDGFLLLYRSVK